MRILLVLIGLAACLVASANTPVRADEAELRAVIAKFADVKKFSDTEAVIDEIAALGDPAAAPALNALSDGTLMIVEADNSVVIVRETNADVKLFDPLTMEPIGTAQENELRKVKIKNSIRRLIADAVSGLTLRAKDPAVRMEAAETMFSRPDASMIETLDEVIANEQDPSVRTAFREARAAAVLQSDLPEAEKIDAIAVLKARGGRDVLPILTVAMNSSDSEAVKAAATDAVNHVEQNLKIWAAGQNLWYGLSLGSVLLLAAIGLAITFGVMGVINMAHGEMVMLGAYTTFVVQEIMRNSAPGLLDWSLVVALPLAFLVAGTVGFALERGVIRFLYGRPLETLLATWGVSLVLQQAVRSIFGPTNREVSNPSWMSGAFELGEMTLTWNRLCIVIFAIAVFAMLLWAFNYTSLGLRMRAVTQNRRMAASMGIRTPWVDALTFALGSGIAGIAGVALSQIDNVSPNLGQSYIIDSFMVVVFGGVGNLWGTLVGALSLGIVNKFLEPYAGAVLGKILVLVFIILFIQKRPRGLFALKGRAVDA
ncbi:urea ABC transporter permease subunit UrtB [Tepidamorphus sp. 3E244]|uniref:urea ABC transporter permease subunit UrtB n=1 Tax=Tepidamorphus sp. 3E244 TaxID=3385498 RepID=UPI0038FCA3E0